MKKLIILMYIIAVFFSGISVWYSNCWIKFDDNNANNTEIRDTLDNCLSWTQLVNWKDAKLENWFKNIINTWVRNLSILFWTLAVTALVYSSLQMTLSTWDDEKIKKSKDMMKWSIFWFLLLISTSAIISLVVRVIYSV